MIDKLILGTVQLGMPYGINNLSGQPTVDESYALLKAAFQKGVRCLDTAEAYGKAQQLIGKYHKENQKFSVITKYSYQSEAITGEIFKERFEANRKMMSVECIEAYLFHSFEVYKNFEHWDIVEQLITGGCLKKIGVSVYTNEQALQVSTDPRIKVVQLPFNLLDNFSLRGDVLTQLHTQNKEVHVRSVFLQGLFYKDRNNLGKLLPLKHNLLQLDRIAKENGLDIGTLALSYCLRQSLVDKVLIGVETKLQLEENIHIALKASCIDNDIFLALDRIRVSDLRMLNPSNW